MFHLWLAKCLLFYHLKTASIWKHFNQIINEMDIEFSFSMLLLGNLCPWLTSNISSIKPTNLDGLRTIQPYSPTNVSRVMTLVCSCLSMLIWLIVCIWYKDWVKSRCVSSMIFLRAILIASSSHLWVSNSIVIQSKGVICSSHAGYKADCWAAAS